jgi:hypothetical protein
MRLSEGGGGPTALPMTIGSEPKRSFAERSPLSTIQLALFSAISELLPELERQSPLNTRQHCLQSAVSQKCF